MLHALMGYWNLGNVYLLLLSLEQSRNVLGNRYCTSGNPVVPTAT